MEEREYFVDDNAGGRGFWRLKDNATIASQSRAPQRIEWIPDTNIRFILIFYAIAVLSWILIRLRARILRERFAHLDRFTDEPRWFSRWTDERLDSLLALSNAFFIAWLYLMSLAGHEGLPLVFPHFFGEKKFEHNVMPNVLRYCAFASLVSIAQFFLLGYGFRSNRKYRMISSILYLVFLGILLTLDLGASTERHGQFNLMIFLGFHLPVIVTVAFAYILSKFIDRVLHRFLIGFGVVLLLFLLSYAYVASYKASWGKGIGGTELEYDWPECDIPHYPTPWIALPTPLLRFVLGSSQICYRTQASFSNISNGMIYVDCPNEKAIVIDQPDYVSRLKSNLFFLGLTLHVAQKTFSYLENRFEYTTPRKVYGDFVEVQCGEKTDYHVNIPAKKDLLGKEQKVKDIAENRTKSNLSKPLNVIVILFDGLSRQQFHDKLPLSDAILEKINSEGDASIHEFFRFTTLGLDSPLNYGALLSGKTWVETSGRRPEFPNSYWWHTKDFTSNHYASSIVFGMCQSYLDFERVSLMAHVNTRYRITNASDYANHYIFSPFCHNSVHPEPFPFAIFNGGSFSSNARCIGGKASHEYQFEMLSKIINHYHGKIPLSIFSSFFESHEITGDFVRVIDGDLSNNIDTWHKKGVFNDSMVIIMSDHGNHMNPFIFTTEEGYLQRRLPLLLFSLPKWLLKKHPHYLENLKSNIQKPLTAIDLYWTIRQAPNPDKMDELPEFSSSIEPRTRSMAQSLVSLMDVTMKRQTSDPSFMIHERLGVCYDGEKFSNYSSVGQPEYWLMIQNQTALFAKP